MANIPTDTLVAEFQAQSGGLCEPYDDKGLDQRRQKRLCSGGCAHSLPPTHLAYSRLGRNPHRQDGTAVRELPKDKLIVLYCWDTWCSLATTSALILLGHGYRVKELFGEVAAWKTLHLPEEIVAAAEAAPAGYSC